MILDKDLASIQEVRNLLAAAKAAQQQIASYPQEKNQRSLSGNCQRLL